MSVTRYRREVRLDDLNNVHTFAVLAVPPGSRVLDLGAAEGSVARVLAARGCTVTAVERDPGGVRALRAAGLRTVQADLDRAADLDLPRAAFDTILLLDVLEHLVNPAALLSRVREWLAPSGQVLISVPHVAHAAVRLALMQGRFPRTDIGLLDRTHLHFFDRAQLDALLAGAGLSPIDILTVELDVHQTELAIDPAAFSPEVVAAATTDATSRIYQYFIIARPGVAALAGGGLLQRLQDRLRSVEANGRVVEAHAREVEAERLALRVHFDRQQRTAVECATRPAVVSGTSSSVDVDPDDVEADRETLRRQLTERMRELSVATETIAALQRELAVQRGFMQSMGQASRVVPITPVRPVEGGGAASFPNDLAMALAAELAEYRRMPYATAFRFIRRMDALLLRVPRVRRVLAATAQAILMQRPDAGK